MKTFVRIVVGIGVVVLVAAAMGWVFRDVFLKRAAVQSLRRQTGLEVEIGSVRSTVFPLSVQIRHLEILNPPGFGEAEAFKLDEFYIAVDRKTLFAEELLLPEVRLRVPSLVVIQDEQGRTNWEQLGRALGQARRRDPRAKPAPEPVPPEEPMPDTERPDKPWPSPGPEHEPMRAFRIGRLETYVGELEIHEYRPGETDPRIRRIPVDREVVFEDVTDLSSVMQQLAFHWAAAALPSLLEEAQRESEDGNALRGLQEMLRRQRRSRREQRDEAATP